MNKAIEQIAEALDQQMELNFFMAGKLIELSPPGEQKRLKKELHARLSALRERTLIATVALEDLVSQKNTGHEPINLKLKRWLTGK